MNRPKTPSRRASTSDFSATRPATTSCSTITTATSSNSRPSGSTTPGRALTSSRSVSPGTALRRGGYDASSSASAYTYTTGTSSSSSPSTTSAGTANAAYLSSDVDVATSSSSSPIANNLTDRLMAKISSQAAELLALKSEVIEKDSKIMHLETQLSKCGFVPQLGTSELAIKRKAETVHRDQIKLLQKQIETAEKRLAESSQMRKQLVVDLEHRTRESKFIEARNEELHSENSQLRALLDSTLNPSTSAGDKVSLRQQVQSLRSELDQTRRELNEQRSDYEDVAGQLQDAQAKCKVLEEALAFRAEEVGLSGQADMLSKLAALRSEVNALKVDLIEKRNRIHDIESDKESTAERNSSLQQQLNEIQERYERSKHDIQLLQNRDEVAKRLAEVESERDVLLEFIQEDVQKNAAITSTLDTAVREAAEFRRAAALAQDEAKRLSELNETQRSHIQGLEGELGTARAELKQFEDVRKRLGKRDMELQEYTKMHLTFVGDLKNRDETIRSLNNECQSLRLQLESMDATTKRMAVERRNCEEQIERLQKEIEPLRQTVVSNASVSVLRGEMDRVQKEYEAIFAEKSTLQEEVQRLNVQNKLIQEINAAIFKLNTEFNASTELSSNKHVSWTSIPAIRLLSPPLFDNIRSLFQDLHAKETECKSMSYMLERYQNDQRLRDTGYNKEMEKFSEQETKLIQQLSEEKALVQLLTREKDDLQSKKLVLDQIRQVLKTTLGSNFQDYISDTVSSRSGKPIPRPSSVTASPYVKASRSLLHNEYIDEDANESFFSRKMENSGIFGAEGVGQSASFDDLVVDQDIPSLMARALSRNLSAAAKLSDYERDIRTACTERDHALDDVARLSSEINSLKAHIDDLEANDQNKENSNSQAMLKLQEEFTSAVALNEKQNALALTLEAKIEELRRKQSVKSAQLLSYQQREATFINQYLNLMTNFCNRIVHVVVIPKIHRIMDRAPDDLTKLEDILDQSIGVLNAVADHIDGRYQSKGAYSTLGTGVSNDASDVRPLNRYVQSQAQERSQTPGRRATPGADLLGRQNSRGEHGPLSSTAGPSMHMRTPTSNRSPTWSGAPSTKERPRPQSASNGFKSTDRPRNSNTSSSRPTSAARDEVAARLQKARMAFESIRTEE